MHNHLDIRKADSQLRDAKLRITETGAQGLPQLNASASYARQDPVVNAQSTDTSGVSAGGVGTNPQFAAFLGTASVNTFRLRMGNESNPLEIPLKAGIRTL